MGTAGGEKRVLAGWAHDLGKPLQVIWSHGRRLAQSDALDRQTRELALAIVALSDDALRVVDCLMESARTHEPQIDHLVLLRETLGRVIAVVQGLHPGCSLSVIGPVPVVEIERPGRTFSALVNLADNAVRASDRCQPVTIRTRLDGDELVIDVNDRGAGMSDLVRMRAFEPYFSSPRNSCSAGLGLSECRAQVESMGGRVEIESVEGHGTCASIVIPCVKGPAGGGCRTC